MTTEENLDLRAPTSPPTTTEAKPNSRIIIIRSLGVVISLVAIVVCGYLLFNLFKDSVDIPLPNLTEQQETQAVQVEEQAPVLNETSVQTAVDAAPKIIQPPLPKLNESDKEVRNAASQLNSALQWADWITTDEAIRKFVVVIDNLATGKISRKYLPIPKPETKFSSTHDGVKETLNTTSFERYNPYIKLFENIDNNMAAVLYQRYLPLMEQAFSELGYANGTFHDTLMQAFDVLLSAPIVTDDIELVRPSVFYKFADPDLEKALPVHKQLIRMGPENTRKLQAKIRQLQTALSPTHQ